MVHRGTSPQYVNCSETENTQQKKKYSANIENPTDEKPLSNYQLPILLNGLELRKIDRKLKNNEEEEKGKSCTYFDKNTMNNNNNNHKSNNNNKNEKIRLRRNSLLISNRNITKKSLIVPSPNMIVKNGSSNSDTNGEIVCNEMEIGADLRCSLPLDRLSGILEKLNLIPKIADCNSGKRTNSSSPDTIHSGCNKTMCLYCDRTFSCQKLQEKHAERVHQATKGRRLSSRTTSATQSAYPGCSFCNVGKISLLLSEDLNDLFSHLIDSHPDKYFACKLCMIRFPGDSVMIAHNQEFHDNNSQIITRPTSPINVEIDFEKNILTNIISTDTLINNTSNDDEDGFSNRLRRTSTTQKKPQLLKNEELILSRLGVTQNRSPRTKRSSKVRTTVETSTRAVRSTKGGRQTVNTSPITLDSSASLSDVLSNSKQLSVVTNSKNNCDISNTTTFDDDFYETVSINVRNNLSCHLDGKLDSKLDGGATSSTPLSPIADPPLRGTVVRSLNTTDSEIHKATALSTITAFPTLLTAEQYGSEPSTSKLKRTFTKNSWKWKWDFIKKYKYVNEGGKIVKKIKQQTSGFRDLSKLDMWTQLTMRKKHELICRRENENANNENLTKSVTSGNFLMAFGEDAREEKQKLIDQLNTILDSRLLPQINLEQNDQRIIKQEPGLYDDLNRDISLNFQGNVLSADEEDFTSMLELRRKTSAELNNENRVILSGEWARPRCYVCFGCGAKFETLKILEEHKSSSHPHVYSTHYEIVGRELIERELYRHFYIPSKALHRHVTYMKRQQIMASGSSEVNENKVVCLEDSMDSTVSASVYSSITKSEICDTDSNSKLSIKLSDISSSNSTTNLSSSVKIIKTSVNCTKCNRECGGTLDLYRHILDCSGDYAWVLAKKRLRYRYFSGNRSRRRRAAGRSNFNAGRPKLIKRKPQVPIKPASADEDINSPRKNEEKTPRSKPSDAESIERMLANLPAKRTCRQIIPNINSKKTRRVRIVPSSLKLSNQNKKNSLQIQRRVTRTNTLLNTTQTRATLQNNRKVNLRNRRLPKSNTEDQAIENVTLLDSVEKGTRTHCSNVTEENCSTSTTHSIEVQLEDALDSSLSQENSSEYLNESQINNPAKKLKQKTAKIVRKLSKHFAGKHRMLRRSSASLLNASSSSSSSEANSPAITKNIMKQISDINSKNEENIDHDVLSTSHQHIKRQFKGNRLMRNNLNFTHTTRNFKLRPARLIVKCHLDEPQTEKLVENESPIVETQTLNKIENEQSEENPIEKLDNTQKVIVQELLKHDLVTPKVSTPVDLEPFPFQSVDLTDYLDTSSVVKPKKKKGRPFKNSKPSSNVHEVSVEGTIEEVTKVLEITEIVENKNPDVEQIQKDSITTNVITHTDESVQKSETSINREDHNEFTQKLVGASKRKPKKLNDCIAMLTGKLQEKLGIPFLNQSPKIDEILATEMSEPDKEVILVEKTTSPIQTIENVGELVPLDLSIGKTKSDTTREAIDLPGNKFKSTSLNILAQSMEKSGDVQNSNSSEQNFNLKLSEGTLLNLSPVKPIPHSELPFQAALPSSTLIYPARLSSVPRSNPFNTTNHSITIRPFISHSIPSMLSNTPPTRTFTNDNTTAIKKTSILSQSSFLNTTLPAKPSVSVCISSQKPSHNNRTSLSPPNLSITQIPTGTSISPANHKLPLGNGNILLTKPSVTITPSYKTNSLAQPPSSISPPLFLFSDTYKRINESKLLNESKISIKTINSLVNNRTLPDTRIKSGISEKHNLPHGLLSGTRHREQEFVKVADLDKIVESIKVVKNSELYDSVQCSNNYKPRRSRKAHNLKLSPMEMVETEMTDDSGDLMRMQMEIPASIEPEVIINEEPDRLVIEKESGKNFENIEPGEGTSNVTLNKSASTSLIQVLEEKANNRHFNFSKVKLSERLTIQEHDSEKVVSGSGEPEICQLAVDSKLSKETTVSLISPLITDTFEFPTPIQENLLTIQGNLSINQKELISIQNTPSAQEKPPTQQKLELPREKPTQETVLPTQEESVNENSKTINQITGKTNSTILEPELFECAKKQFDPEADVETMFNNVESRNDNSKLKQGLNKKKTKSKVVKVPELIEESVKTQIYDEPKLTEAPADEPSLENPREGHVKTDPNDTKQQNDFKMSTTENEQSQAKKDSGTSVSTNESKSKEIQTNLLNKPRRKRQSELTAIIADQLLESFKEVDKSRIDELKLLHELSLENSQTDDIILPVVQSTPKRKAAVNKKLEEVKPEKTKVIKKSAGKKRFALTESSISEEHECQPDNIVLSKVDELRQLSISIDKENKVSEYISPKRRSARLTSVISLEIPTESERKLEIDTSSLQKIEISPTTNKTSDRNKSHRISINHIPQTNNVDCELKSTETESRFDNNVKENVTLKTCKGNNKKIKDSTVEPVIIENNPLDEPETPLRRKSARNQAKQEESSKIEEIVDISNSLQTKKFNTPQIVDQTSSNESDDDLSLAQLAKNLLTKPSESAVREDVISSISDNRPLDVEDEGQNLKRTVEFNLDQNNVKVLNPPQLNDFDDNTNTELVDMDLEDETMSVYTSISIDTSITLNPSSSGKPKKRKRRSILLKSRKQRGPKFDESNVLGYECEICNKAFRKQDSLSKHKMTLTHIAKLSEQEFLNSKNEKLENSQIVSPLREILSTTPIFQVPEEIENENILSSALDTFKTVPIAINNSGIEPISSPEQFDANYDRYRSISSQKENSRFNLSQEEKLFFECCNMLKGSSDQTTNLSSTTNTNHFDSINNRKPIAKANGNVESNLLFTNTQHPLFTSPTKIDPNQFSDISSDSNPIVFNKKHTDESLEQTKNDRDNESIITQDENLKSNFILDQDQRQAITENKPNSNNSNVSHFLNKSLLLKNYSDLLSDTGESFPSSPDASENNIYSQTVPEQSTSKISDDFTGNINPDIDKSNSNLLPYNAVETGYETVQADNRTTFESPIHSNSSQSSTTSKLITKGALKGYDNFKVSIPTIGIDLQQALVRSSHVGSKLATLADIALSSDVPATAGLFRAKEETIKNKKPTDSTSMSETQSEVDQTNAINEIMIDPTAIKSDAKATITQAQTPIALQQILKIPDIKIPTRTTSNRKSNGNKLGFKAKKHLKQAKRNKAKQDRNKKKGNNSEEKRSVDIYEFEDSFDSVDEPILPLSKVAGGFRAKLLTKEMVELGTATNLEETLTTNRSTKKDKSCVLPTNPSNEESQMSSTSFSDRDDFNFGVDSGVSESSDSERETSPGLNKLPDTTNNLQKKCLIMGRIFKNVKKCQPQPVDIGASDSKSCEKVNKLPKQELDKLFDSLKEVESKLSVQHESESAELSQLFNENQSKSKKGSRKGENVGNRKSKKSSEMQMLEAEMGMSLEQIKEIIGVGQRKSQRKCATAKPKILAETWSSDEYEDFHTTKDIIALIQETEIKALQRRNRNKTKEKSEQCEKLQDASTSEISVSLRPINEKQLEEETNVIVSESSIIINTCGKRIDESESKTPTDGNTVENQKTANKINFALKDKKENNSNVNNKKFVKIQQPPQRRKSMSANNTTVKPQRLVYYDSESDFEADWNRSSKRSKIKKRRKTTAFKEINKTEPKSPKNSVKPSNRPTTSDPESKPNKNRTKNIKHTEGVIIDNDGKESKIPMSRRKRIASEMLYYWSSSSSDEEFGRVDGTLRRRRNRPVRHDEEDDDDIDDDLTQDGEHLQQHGWIVGDSHKKLVTLLAHAKGKMTDDCGVKESGSKKKS